MGVEMACVQGWHEFTCFPALHYVYLCVCVCVIVMKGLIWPLIRVDEGTFCKFLLGLCHGPGSYSLVVHSGGPASIHGQIMWDLKGDKLH